MLKEIVIHTDMIEFRHDDKKHEYEIIEGSIKLCKIKTIAKKYTVPIITVGVHARYYEHIVLVERGIIQDGLITDNVSKKKKIESENNEVMNYNKCYLDDFL